MTNGVITTLTRQTVHPAPSFPLLALFVHLLLHRSARALDEKGRQTAHESLREDLGLKRRKNTPWGWFSPCLHGKSKTLKRGALDLDHGRAFHLVCMASAWYWGLSRGHSSVLPTPGPSWKNWQSDIGHSWFFLGTFYLSIFPTIFVRNILIL